MPFTDRDLHAWLLRAQKSRLRGTLRGVGDDCAVVRTGGEEWAWKIDPVMEGVHFEHGCRDAAAIAWKAVARAASDFAAAPALPRFGMVSLELPTSVTRAWSESLLSALGGAFRTLRIQWVGGHTALRSPRLAVHVTLLGPMLGPAWRRGGARRGDVVLVTGALGGSSLGRHFRFRPRLDAARALCTRGVRAAIDLSDGLSVDGLAMALASRVGVVVDAPAIPIAPAAYKLAKKSGKNPLFHALHDGEDYELLLAVPPQRLPGVMTAARRHRIALRRVGICIRGEGVHLRDAEGRITPIEPRGYVHRSR